MEYLKIIELRNEYILNGINLEVRNGELFVILGPSGAGKTTLLNAIAGLIEYNGKILINGKSIDNLPPEKRNVGMVFQEPALFPHMTVAENIEFGLKIKKVSDEKIKEKVNYFLELTKLSKLKDRYPKTLSGGEKQRVAIARALITDPKLILMDEPFNNLDPRLRKYLREEYKRIQGELNATTIFVTHDMKEAKELGDRIAIMSNGRIIQVGKFENIISSPANLEVFDFIGQPNILNCDSYELIDYGLAKAYCNNLEIIVPYEDQPIRKIIVYPENIYIYKNKPEGVRINILKV